MQRERDITDEIQRQRVRLQREIDGLEGLPLSARTRPAIGLPHGNLTARTRSGGLLCLPFRTPHPPRMSHLHHSPPRHAP